MLRSATLCGRNSVRYGLVNSRSLSTFRASVSPLAYNRLSLPNTKRSVRNYWGSPKPTPPSALPPTPEFTPEPAPLAADLTSASTPVPEPLFTPLDAPLPDASALAELAKVAPVEDLAALGLTSLWPPGLAISFLTFLHTACALPWFHTIVVGSIAARLVTLPFSINASRASARLRPYQTQLQALNAHIKASYASRDTAALDIVRKETAQIHKKAGASPAAAPLAAFVQLPVSIGMFLGIQRMCYLPLESLKDSGFALLPDLTVADPTYILPALSTLAIFATIRTPQVDMPPAAPGAPHPGHMANGISAITLIFFPLLATLPIGVNLFTLTGALFGLAQVRALRVPSVRSFLNIPGPHTAPVPLPTFGATWTALQTHFAEKAAEAAKEAAKRGKKP